jgi:hypothetical protein
MSARPNAAIDEAFSHALEGDVTEVCKLLRSNALSWDWERVTIQTVLEVPQATEEVNDAIHHSNPETQRRLRRDTLLGLFGAEVYLRALGDTYIQYRPASYSDTVSPLNTPEARDGGSPLGRPGSQEEFTTALHVQLVDAYVSLFGDRATYRVEDSRHSHHEAWKLLEAAQAEHAAIRDRMRSRRTELAEPNRTAATAVKGMIVAQTAQTRALLKAMPFAARRRLEREGMADAGFPMVRVHLGAYRDSGRLLEEIATMPASVFNELFRRPDGSVGDELSEDALRFMWRETESGYGSAPYGFEWKVGKTAIEGPCPGKARVRPPERIQTGLSGHWKFRNAFGDPAHRLENGEDCGLVTAIEAIATIGVLHAPPTLWVPHQRHFGEPRLMPFDASTARRDLLVSAFPVSPASTLGSTSPEV